MGWVGAGVGFGWCSVITHTMLRLRSAPSTCGQKQRSGAVVRLTARAARAARARARARVRAGVGVGVGVGAEGWA